MEPFNIVGIQKHCCTRDKLRRIIVVTHNNITRTILAYNCQNLCDYFLFTLMKKKYHQIFYAVFFFNLLFSCLIWISRRYFETSNSNPSQISILNIRCDSSWFIVDKSGFLSKLSDGLDSSTTDDAILIMINLFIIITHVDQFLLVLS